MSILARLLFLASCVFLNAAVLFAANETLPHFQIDRSDEGLIARELRINRTWSHLDMAYRLQAQGDLAGAVRELRAYLAIDPRNDNIRLQLVTLLVQVGDNEAAEVESTLLIRNHPTESLPLLYRAQARERLGHMSLVQTDYQQALAKPGLTARQRSDTALALAHAAQLKGDYAQVLAALKTGGADLPAQADYLRGLALSGLGQHSQALEALQQAAVRSDSQKERSIALRAAAEEASHLDLLDAARSLLQQAGQEGAFEPELELRLALLEARSGRHDAAVDLLTHALAEGLAADKSVLAWEQLGYSLIALNRHAEAERAWLKAKTLSSDASRPDLLTALGDNAWAAKQHEQAADYYEQAWQSGGKQDISLSQRAAAAWARAGRHEQALHVYLALANDSTLDLASRHAALESVAYLQRQSGRPATAAATLIQSTQLAGLSIHQRDDLLHRATTLYLEAGDTAKVKALLRQRIVDMPQGSERAAMLLTLAEQEESIAALDWQIRTLETLNQAEAQPGLSTDMTARIAEAKARAFRADNNDSAAVQALQHAIAVDGETSRRQLELGYLYASLDDYARSRDAFSQAVALGADYHAAVGLAQAYQRLGQPGLGLHTLEQAVLTKDSDLAALPLDERVTVLGLLGYLSEELQRPVQAANYYDQALMLRADPVLRFRLARALYATGQAARADQLLHGLVRAELPADEHLAEVMLRARVAKDLGRATESESIYRQAIAESSSAELWHELGGVLRARGEHEAAAEAFAQAEALQNAPAYLVAQGYELLALERRKDAQPLLTKGVLAEPDYLAAHQDLGYIAMQRGDNDLAVEHFTNAIDYAPLRPVPNDQAARDVAEDVHRMRGEVRALTNAVDADLWLTYSTGKTGSQQSGGGGALERDVVRTSSGVELGWIPPQWGFQDQRIFKFIGRLTWNMEPDSLEVQDDSWVGALGVRYKPFKAHNLNLGVERLFSFSGQGEDSWVARAMYSVSDGLDDVHPDERWWNYSFLFGEVDAYLDSFSRLGAYAEGRQGFSYKVGDDLVLSPFVVADASWWSDSQASGVSFYEGGLGLSTRVYFDEDKYELPRRNVELLMTYKIGRIYEADNIKDDEINAFFATVLFRF